MLLNVLLCAMAAATLTLGAGPQAPPASAAAPAVDELLKREQQRVALLTSGKLDELAALLSPTLTYTHSSAAMDDKARFLETLRSGQVVYKSLQHSDVQVRFPTPDVAVLNGLSTVEVVIGGKPQTIPLRFTIVYVKKNGQWLMELWHSARRPA